MGKMSEKYIEVIEEWEDNIRSVWTTILKAGIRPNFSNPDTYVENTFLSEIWNMSINAFDIPREVQVVVDNMNRLFISFGTPGFVDFTEMPVGMSLPLKCWIHTHPFGRAYFSHTDWTTIKTWESVMETAIVLGDNQYWAYHIESQIVKTVQFATLEAPDLTGESE